MLDVGVGLIKNLTSVQMSDLYLRLTNAPSSQSVIDQQAWNTIERINNMARQTKRD